MRCATDAMANAGEHSNAGILIIGLRFPAEGSYNSYSKSSPMTFPITPKNLIGLSAILLMLAVVFWRSQYSETEIVPDERV
jgi:hypothetical protein